jgi:hypothetical protein
MSAMELRALTDDETLALQAGLALAARMAGAESRLSASQVQALYNAALDNEERDIERLIAIGLAFGDLIVDGAEFEWARISDQWGNETCVAVVGKMTHCAPISMIQKRIGRVESADIAQLRDSTIDAMRSHAAKSMDR